MPATIETYDAMSCLLEARLVCQLVESTLNYRLQSISCSDERTREAVDAIAGASTALGLLADKLQVTWNDLDSLASQ